MSKRRHFSGQDKVKILREHLEEGKQVSEVCEKYDIHPNLFYKWKKDFFESAASYFEKHGSNGTKSAETKRLKALEAKVSSQHMVISEITAENIELRKKYFGGV